MKRWNLGAVLAALLVAGCTGGGAEGDKAPGKAGPAAASKTFKIAMIAKSSTNPVFLSAKKGAEDAAAELSKSGDVAVTIDWRTPPNEDAQVQAQNLAAAVNEGANAVLMACSDAGKVKGAIDDAVAKGVPVMMFDSDCKDSKRFAFYGPDDVAGGEQLMQELAKLMGDKGEVAILAGNSHVRRIEAQHAIVRRAAQLGNGIDQQLLALARDTTKPLNNRTAALFTYKQLRGAASTQAIAAMVSDPTIAALALETGIATEVENAWQQFVSARNLMERIRASLLAEARQVRDITEFSYRRGEASLLEFLDAQRAYNDAMQSYNDARADYVRSLFLLDSVTGKLVSQ